MKQNFKMTVAYDGTRYYGWEHQPGNEMTIQGKLESVLNEMVHADRTHGVTVIGAGRTDAGVHARAMTCNVILDTELTALQIQQYMNRYLPDDISVNEVKEATDRFHARFKAVGKTYRYQLWYSEDGSRPVFDRRYCTVLSEKPDLAAMQEAALRLTGMHDYKSFCGNSRFSRSSVRVVDSIEIKKSGNRILLYFHGNGFLQNMVRIMTGTLLEAGYGRIRPEDIDEILAARDRKKAGPTAPAKGLTLMKVDYD